MMCLRIHPYLSLSIISRQTRVALVALARSLLFTVVNHTREHVNILEYTEHFRTYTDLGNQGATNAGENVRYIHTWAVVTINVGLA